MMPQGQGGGPLGMLITRWVKRLMIATVVLSLVGGIALAWMGSSAPLLFVLEPAAVWGQGELAPGVPALWQLLTYPFFIFDPIGLLFAVLLYGWFAGSMEAWWGSKRFLRFVVLVVVGSAVLTTLLAFFWPRLAVTRVMGPYPLLEGLIIAWGLTFPDREVRLFFVLPVKGIHLVWITLGIVALYIVFAGSLVPFVPQLFGMAIAALAVTGVWRLKSLRLHLKKMQVDQALRREEAQRRQRVEEARHLRVVKGEDPDQDEPRKKNGAGDSGWLN